MYSYFFNYNWLRDDDCDGTPNRIRDRTKLQLKDKDCTKLQTMR